MSTIDIHPEDLFDRLTDGTLSDVEGERLRAHLDACDVCRFELAVRGDFRAESSRADAPAETPKGQLTGELTRPAGLARRRRTRRAFVWVAAAAAFLMATGALASVLTGKTPWQLLPVGAGAPPVDAAAQPRRPQRSAPQSSATSAPPSSAAPVALAASQPPEPTPAEAAESERSAARSEPLPPRLAQSEAATTAAALFKAANRARGSGEVTGAVKLYRRLQREFPSSAEATLSQLTLATLLLHTGDSRAALSGFDAYLARGSRPLEAEALVGRALALRALGQGEAEIAAWTSILRRYPGSSYARRASDRLAAVGRL